MLPILPISCSRSLSRLRAIAPAFVRRFIHKKRSAAITSAATPPMTLPAIAPALDGFVCGVGVGVGVGEAVEVGATKDESAPNII